MSLLNELVAKNVLKGSDTDLTKPFTFRPYHAGRLGNEIELIPAQKGPIWFSSRFVLDHYKRSVRGSGSRFSSENQPPKQSPKVPIGDTFGYGPSSSSSSSSSVLKQNTPRQAAPALCERVWEACGWRKVGKAAALKSIEKAIRAVADARTMSHDQAAAYLMERATAYTASPIAQAEMQYRPHPTTWFNQGRYDDDPATWQHSKSNARTPAAEVNKSREYSSGRPAPIVKVMP